MDHMLAMLCDTVIPRCRREKWRVRVDESAECCAIGDEQS